MESGQYAMAIFFGVAVIVGAIFIALMYSFLNDNNRQLRELTTELKARREEEQSQAQSEAPRIAEAAASADGKPIPAEPTAMPPAVAAPARPRAAAPLKGKRTLAPEALAAIQRGAAMAAPGPRAMSGNTPAVPAMTQVQTAQAILESEAVIASATLPAAAVSQTTTKKDWNTLLTRRSGPSQAALKPAVYAQPVKVEVRQDLLDAMLGAASSQKTATSSQQAAASSPQAAPSPQPAAAWDVVPSGFHDGYVLSRLVQAHQPVSGLVVSIGVNTADSNAPQPNGHTPASPQVRELIQSLIGAGDFACQSGTDEFLLIYPQERGASAQRRLSSIAQQLWNFQLQALGEFQILCSWGGVEVRSESIVEAIASARERMQETQRGRKQARFEAPLQQAV
jgi:hypothetical protein